jgi:hypothetical protein
MPRALAILFGFAFTVACCCLLGSLAVRRLPLLVREERWPFAFIVGSAMLSGVMFLLSAAHLAHRGIVLALAVALGAWAWRVGALREMRRGEHFANPIPRGMWILFLILFVPFSFCYWANSMAPEWSPDGSSYHLGWVAKYAAAQGFERPEASIYGLLSQGIEMLFLHAFLFGRHSAAAMVHWAFVLDLVWLLICFGRRIANPAAGLAAAIFVYASPVVCIDGSSAYIDLATACVGFALFYLLYLWDAVARHRALLVAAGLLAGFTYAAKYTAAILAVWAALFVLWRSRDKVRDFAAIASMTLVLSAPWMIRNAVLTGNPVAPFFNRIFPNPHVHVLFEQAYSEYLRNYGLENKWELPLEVTVRGAKTSGALGYLFLLSPLAIFAARRREGRMLLLAGLFALAPFPLNVGTRFLIPALPFVAMALALVLDVKVLLPFLMIAHAALGWPNWPPGLLQKVSHEHAWRLIAIPWKAALRIESEDGFLRRRSDGYLLARMVDAAVEPGARVLAENGYADAYTNREALIGYQSAVNEKLMDIFYTGFDDSRWPRLVWSFKLPQPQGIRRVRIAQTFASEVRDEQWNVSEIRLFDAAGAELPRDPSWRLTAKPNPWDVQMAFDNSPVTRWRSWETARPGMYIEASLGGARNVARVEVQSSWDNPNCRLKLLVEREGSTSLEETKIEPQLIEGQTRVWMRREATRELLSRGVQYLLLSPDEFGGRDLFEAQSEWGVSMVAEGTGKRLFRIEPYVKRSKE